MKFLSLITVLIVLVTLFTLVISQLNKDETKHEYGIAFPLEETETRFSQLVPLPSGAELVIEKQKPQQQQTKSNEQATTTTETVATSLNSDANNKITNKETEVNNKDVTNEFDPLYGITSSISTIQQNESDGNGNSKDTGSKDDDSNENTNPKLIFIERLMDLNFQRSPGFSSFLDVRDTQDSDNNKTSKTDSNDDGSSKDDVSWSNALDNIRSKWENRIRKFTYPFQNTYSVVLRASNVVDPSTSGTNGDNIDQSNSERNENVMEKSNKIDVQSDNNNNNNNNGVNDSPMISITPNVKFFYHQSSGPMMSPQSSLFSSVHSSANPHANQLFRMAALAMMSKLFSALRSQALTPSKLESGHKIGGADIENHEIDLDDDDDDMENDDRPTETISVPILVGQKSRNLDQESEPMDSAIPTRTTIMYGRPSPLHYHQIMGPKIYPQPQQQSLPNPLAAVLQAAISRQPNYRRLEQPEPQPLQPQRLILLITHRTAANEPTVREEPVMYYPSQSQTSYAYYSPLSPPSSPIFYQYNTQQLPQQLVPTVQHPQAVVASDPHVVEVPVPVYVPVRVRTPIRPIMAAATTAAVKPIISPRVTQTGPVAIVYYHNNDQPNESNRMANENAYSQQHPTPATPMVSNEPDSEPLATNHAIVRILLRPKSGSLTGATGPTIYHRRLEHEFTPEEDHSHQSPVVSNLPLQYDGRLQQWGDYQQQQQQQHQHQPQNHHQHNQMQQQTVPTVMTHVLLAATGRSNEDDASTDQDGPAPIASYHQHYAPSHVSPFYYSDMEQQGPQAQQQGQQISSSSTTVGPMITSPHDPTQQIQGASISGHAAFLILADPNEGMINVGNQDA